MDFLTQELMPLLANQPAANGVIKPLGHHELLLILLQLAVLLLVARGLGELMRRIGLPPVVGELLAGVLLEPSLLGWRHPPCRRQSFPRVRLSPICWRWFPGWACCFCSL